MMRLVQLSVGLMARLLGTNSSMIQYKTVPLITIVKYTHAACKQKQVAAVEQHKQWSAGALTSSERYHAHENQRFRAFIQ
jgi:hypothetical protein